MRTCSHCGKENPDDAAYCNHCGNSMAFSKPPATSRWKRIPSWGWILILVVGVIGLIAFFIGSFVAIATIEGVASAVMLIAGMIGFGVTPLRKPQNTSGFTRALGIAFFALMGISVDQTGNYLYNKPVEMTMCDGGTLTRKENVSNPVPGSTYIEQDFVCYNDNGEPIKRLNIFAVMGIRFLEYILLGYLLLFARRVLWNATRGSS